MSLSNAILLIHGYATDADDFKNIIEELHDRYQEVVAETLPSHLKRDHLKTFNVDEAISFFESQYESLIKKYGTIDIMGFSMGGAIATYLASKGNVENLILLAPANDYLNGHFPISKLKLFLDYLLSTMSLESKDIKTYRKELFIDGLKDSQKSLDVALKKLLPNYTIHSLLTFKDVIKYCNSHIDSIDSDTLIIYGTVDQLVPKSCIKHVARHCKQSKTVILPGISHLMLNSNNYEVVKDTILDFLDKKEKTKYAA